MNNRSKWVAKGWASYTPEQRAARIASLKKAFQNPETKRRLSSAQKHRWTNATSSQRAKWVAATTRAVNRPEIVRKKSLATWKAFQRPEAKQRLIDGIRKGLTPERGKKISEAVKKSWQDPKVRRRHFRHGFTVKGGTGRPPVGFAKELMATLEPLGYKRDFCIKNPFCKRGRGGRITNGAPIVYFIDFALPEKKIAIECDGPRHRASSQKPVDARRDKILRALGWKVIRVQHGDSRHG